MLQLECKVCLCVPPATSQAFDITLFPKRFLNSERASLTPHIMVETHESTMQRYDMRFHSSRISRESSLLVCTPILLNLVVMIYIHLYANSIHKSIFIFLVMPVQLKCAHPVFCKKGSETLGRFKLAASKTSSTQPRRESSWHQTCAFAAVADSWPSIDAIAPFGPLVAFALGSVARG